MLPEKYQWLDTIGVLPKLVSTGLQFLGVREIKGKENNPVIMNMAKELGIGDIYVSDDEQSWCALFTNYLIKLVGKPAVDIQGDKYNLLRAKWLLHWGHPVQKGDEKLGDILIFSRDGGGHVGLCIADTGSTYVVLGGNQSNSVSFTEIAKDRLIGVRRYYATAAPASVKKYMMNSSGLVSNNEQ